MVDMCFKKDQFYSPGEALTPAAPPAGEEPRVCVSFSLDGGGASDGGVEVW